MTLPWRTGMLLGTTVLVLQGVLSPCAVARPAAEGAPGAPGAGDPYFPRDGNGGFEVRHYELSLRYTRSSGRLDGTAVISARTTQALSRFDLDFKLRATSVTVNRVHAEFRRRGAHELVITPDQPIAEGAGMRVVVTYHGFPGRITRPSGVPWWQATRNSTFVNGEPHGATVWYPLSDHPSDKATYDITVSVPQPWKAISVGELVGHHAVGSQSVWHWRVAQPMASYLAFLGLGPYAVSQGRIRGLTYTYAWSSFLRDAERAKIRRALANTPQYVAWLGRRLGRYPFDHIGGTAPGGVVVPTIESQTAPVYGHYVFQRPELARTTMVHELAHQWFGDSVSIEHWRHLWLNEGFAKYMEWWYDAGHGGPSRNDSMLAYYRAVPRDDPWWTIRPGDPGPGRNMFTSVYARGAMTLQALCNTVGPGAFDRILRTWTHDHRYGNATTREFIALAERVSGKELSHLFWVWLYRPHKPAHTVANGFPR